MAQCQPLGAVRSHPFAEHISGERCITVGNVAPQGRERLLSDLRRQLAISNEAHAEIMAAVLDGVEPPRVLSAAAARCAPHLAVRSHHRHLRVRC